MIKYLKYALLIAVLLLPQLVDPAVLIRKEQIEDAYAVLEAVGGDTEATDTTASTTDYITMGSLSIPKTDVIIIIVSLRKSTGGAHSALVGLKLNGTAVKANRTWSGSGNDVDTGSATFVIPAHDGTYVDVGWLLLTGETVGTDLTQIDAVDIPNATITEIIITGETSNSAITQGMQNARVYTFPGSFP